MKLPPAQRRHLPFYLAVLAGLAALAIAWGTAPEIAIEAGANTFFALYLALSLRKFPRLTAAFLKKHAAGADEPAWVIFAVTAGAVAVAVGSLFALINSQGPYTGLQLFLSLASVALGWLTIHTMAALHYAHRYWRPSGDDDVRAGTRTAPGAGLAFPGTKEPEGFDFLYFALVIGMTAQTSDVGITTTAMRKLNMVHAVVSFFFNTVLVAAAVNLAVSIGHLEPERAASSPRHCRATRHGPQREDWKPGVSTGSAASGQGRPAALRAAGRHRRWEAYQPA